MKKVYEVGIKNASSNALIDEQERLWLLLAHKLGDDVDILADYEEITTELGKREGA